MIESYFEIEERKRKAGNRKAYAIQALCFVVAVTLFLLIGTSQNVTDPNDQAFLFLIGVIPFIGIGLYFSTKIR